MASRQPRGPVPVSPESPGSSAADVAVAEEGTPPGTLRQGVRRMRPSPQTTSATTADTIRATGQVGQRLRMDDLATPTRPTTREARSGGRSGSRGGAASGSAASYAKTKHRDIFRDSYRFKEDEMLKTLNQAISNPEGILPELITEFQTFEKRYAAKQDETIQTRFVELVEIIHDIVNKREFHSELRDDQYEQYTRSFEYLNNVLNLYYGRLYYMRMDGADVGLQEWSDIVRKYPALNTKELELKFSKIKRFFSEPNSKSLQLATMPTPTQAHSVFYTRFVMPPQKAAYSESILEASRLRETELGDLRSTLEETERQLNTLRDELVKKQAEESKCKDELATLTRRLADKDEEIGGLKIRLQQQQQQHEADARLLQERLRNLVVAQEEALARHREGDASKQAEIERKEEEIGSLRKQIQNLDDDRAAQQQSGLESLEKIMAEKRELESRISALQEELSKRLEEMEELRLRLKVISDENSRLKDGARNYTTNTSRVERRVIELESELERYQAIEQEESQSLQYRDHVLGMYLAWIIGHV